MQPVETVAPAPRSRLARAANAVRSGWRSTLRFTLDFGLPPLCPACRGVLGDDGGLCASCWSKLSFIARPYCERLGIPFGYDPGPGVLSTEAVANPPAFHRARAAVRYDEIARALVHSLKYGDRLDLAPAMGRWMARAGRELTEGADAPAANGVPVLDEALKRVRATAQQVGLAKAERAANVQGAFQVPDDRRAQVDGKRLVLIDDVLTSGATLDACARALLRAGAAQVDVLTFARVVDGIRNPI